MFEFYNKDCIELIKSLESNSVDCVITDPPYNISIETNFSTMKDANRQGMDFGDWDKGTDIFSYIDYLPRVLKQNANVVIFNCWENLGDIKKRCDENNIFIKRCLVLSKRNPAPFNRDRMFVNDVEFALWGVYNSKGKPTKWIFNRSNPLEKCVIETTVQTTKYHPTSKDPKVITYLIELLTNEGNVVLDPFVGGVQLRIVVNY